MLDLYNLMTSLFIQTAALLFYIIETNRIIYYLVLEPVKSYSLEGIIAHSN